MKFLPESDPAPEINVVALIDVVFAIVTFLVISSLSLSRTEGLPVNLPQANSGQVQDQTKIVLTINAQNQIFLNRQLTNIQDVVAQTTTLFNKNKNSIVVIHADAQVDHGQVVSLMDRIRKISGVKLGIATKR